MLLGVSFRCGVMRRPRLVKDWHKCGRWLSMRLIAASVALQLAFMALPYDARAYLPEWMTRWIAIVLLVGTFAGRLIDQDTKGLRHEHDSEGDISGP